MNAIHISESDLYNAPNVNGLPLFMMFNNEFTWNVQAGAGSGSNTTSNVLEGQRSLRLTSTVATGITLNSGGTQTQFSILESGNYIFSFRKLEADLGITTNSVATNVKMYINGSATDFTFFTESDAEQKDIFKTYYGNIFLEQDDVISFAFSVAASDVGIQYKQYFDCFKLEKDFYGIGYPTVFSPPTTITDTLPTADGLYGLRVLAGVYTWEIIPE